MNLIYTGCKCFTHIYKNNQQNAQNMFKHYHDKT